MDSKSFAAVLFHSFEVWISLCFDSTTYDITLTSPLAINLHRPHPFRHLSGGRVVVTILALEAQHAVLPAVADQQRPVHVQRHGEWPLQPRPGAGHDLPRGAARAPGAAHHAVVLGALGAHGGGTRGTTLEKLRKLMNHGWGDRKVIKVQVLGGLALLDLTSYL